MSADLFRVRLARAQVHPDDLTWMPKWLDAYARFQRVNEGALPVEQEGVLNVLRSLRDRGVSAWQRLQAVRSVEWHQSLALHRYDVDFSPFKRKLGELAEMEKRIGKGGGCGEGFAGEGLPGWIDPTEPEAVRTMRAWMRVLHHPTSTATAYVNWVQRFIRHVDNE